MYRGTHSSKQTGRGTLAASGDTLCPAHGTGPGAPQVSRVTLAQDGLGDAVDDDRLFRPVKRIVNVGAVTVDLYRRVDLCTCFCLALPIVFPGYGPGTLTARMTVLSVGVRPVEYGAPCCWFERGHGFPTYGFPLSWLVGCLFVCLNVSPRPHTVVWFSLVEPAGQRGVENIFTDVGTLPPNSVYPVFIQGERRVTAKPAFTYDSSTLATGYPVPIPTDHSVRR